MRLHCNTHGIDLEIDGSIRRISLPPMGGGRSTLCALAMNPDVERTPGLLEHGIVQVNVRDLDGRITGLVCEVVLAT